MFNSNHILEHDLDPQLGLVHTLVMIVCIFLNCYMNQENLKYGFCSPTRTYKPLKIVFFNYAWEYLVCNASQSIHII